MKWIKEGKKQIAQGEDGKFVIEKVRGLYKATYIGNITFVLPRHKSIKVVKEMCENNYYWEE
ncbi:MAG: hypothetical protein IJ301_02140 [Clostridia bacterium]|nr:hypothetical protein [Clostridia bacterium]